MGVWFHRPYDFTDYLLTAFDQSQHTLACASGEVFTFCDTVRVKQSVGD